MECAGKVGEEPLEGPVAEAVSFQVLHLVQDQHQAAAEGFLRVAEEQIGKPLDLERAGAQIVPETIVAVAEIGNMLLDPLDEISEEDPWIPVRRIEPVPD